MEGKDNAMLSCSLLNPSKAGLRQERCYTSASQARPTDITGV